MNIFNRLYDFIYKKQTQESLNNRMTLALNPELDNEPFIKIIITDTSDDACKKFAEMLYSINSGSYYESIINLLMNMSKEDDTIKQFVETAIIYWGYLLKENLNDTSINNKNSKNNKWIDKPLVMPTDFNKNAK